MSTTSTGSQAPSEFTVRRDGYGIAHVTAPDARTAFAAQGWVAAADRIWQMEWDRRRALGRWAEVVGWVAAPEDAFFRRLGLAEAAQTDAAALSSSAQEMIEAYADGVNAWLDANRSNLPPEFEFHPEPPERWAPWHCVAVYKVRHIFMGTLGRKLWRGYVAATAGVDVMAALRLDPTACPAMVAGPGPNATGPATAPDLEAGLAELRADGRFVRELLAVLAAAGAPNSAATNGETADPTNSPPAGALPVSDDGSNSWVLAGSRTASGMPLLAGDPHRGIEFPNVYHQCHVSCDEFDAIGLAFPGVPGFPHFGHNPQVAWCITHGMADDTDVFVERFDEHHQLLAGSAEQGDVTSAGQPATDAAGADPIDWRSEEIRVRGGTPDGQPSATVWCGSTPRGPVVLGDPADGVALSVMWTGMWGRDTTFEALRPMLGSPSCAALNEAVRPWTVPVNNQLSADRDGNVSFQIRGQVVERHPVNRWVPVPGDGEFSWDGLEPVGFDDLPAVHNPASGVLATANNRTSSVGPYVSLDFAGPSRFNRITELLAPTTAATTDDMTAIHSDVRSGAAPAFVEALLAHATRCQQPRAPEVLAALADWDCQMTANSYPASVYAVVRRRWAEGVAARLGLGEVSFGAPGWPRAAEASSFIFGGATALLTSGGWNLIPGIETPDQLATVLSACVDEATVELSQRLGDDPVEWQWGRLHRMASPHPLATQLAEQATDVSWLNPPVDSCPGDGDTVRAGATVPETGERAAAASVARYVFDLADWDSSGWVVPHGVSGVRGSGHDLDQREAWLETRLVPMHYSEEAVHAATVSQQTVQLG